MLEIWCSSGSACTRGSVWALISAHRWKLTRALAEEVSCPRCSENSKVWPHGHPIMGTLQWSFRLKHVLRHLFSFDFKKILCEETQGQPDDNESGSPAWAAHPFPLWQSTPLQHSMSSISPIFHQKIYSQGRDLPLTLGAMTRRQCNTISFPFPSTPTHSTFCPICLHKVTWASQVVQWCRIRLSMQEIQEIQLQSLIQEDPLEEEMATCSSILAWKIPWTEEPAGQQSVESQSWTQLRDWACSRAYSILWLVEKRLSYHHLLYQDFEYIKYLFSVICYTAWCIQVWF